MKKAILRKVVRFKLSRQSVKEATKLAEKMKSYYLELVQEVSVDQGKRVVVVPESMGVDSDMTHWSYFQLLEHNAIVNRNITRVVRALMTGEGAEQLDEFDTKKDVLPSAETGQESVEDFTKSVDEHIAYIGEFGHLKSSARRDHPIFGAFDAHMWHGMFGLHLKVHANQAKMIAEHSN